MESAIVLGIFLTLVLGILDLASGVYRFNILSEAARRGTREAIVHGSEAPPQRISLGPTTWNGTAADSGDVATAIRPILVGMDPADVTIRLEWPDGSNTAPNRVRCRVSTEFQPISFGLTGRTLSLSASSTMAIAN